MQVAQFLVLLGGLFAGARGQAAAGPKIEDNLKCVSGFCLPNRYKKLETPITEG